MAEDMNGEASRVYQDAATAQLSERVTNMGRRINDVEVEMRAGFNQLGSSLNAATNETRTSIATLSSTMADRSRPQWQALSVMLAVLVVLGGLVYWPIRESTGDLKAAVLTLSQETNRSFEMIGAKMVTREELDWRAARGQEDRVRTDATITDLRATMASRAEWSERNLSRDKELDTIRADAVRDITNVQRQIDQLRGDFVAFASSLGNGRDSFADLKEEQMRLRNQLADLMSRMAGLPSGVGR